MSDRHADQIVPLGADDSRLRELAGRFTDVLSPSLPIWLYLAVGAFLLGWVRLASPTWVFLGSVAWWFVLTTGVAAVRGRVTPAVLLGLNRLSGVLILAFGVRAIATGLGLG